jgi:hypothetical protein
MSGIRTHSVSGDRQLLYDQDHDGPSMVMAILVNQQTQNMQVSLKHKKPYLVSIVQAFLKKKIFEIPSSKKALLVPSNHI